jgi:HNH endonuclease
MRGRPATPAIDRVMSKVTVTDGCHLWTGDSNDLGYGRVRSSVAPYRTIYAHRVVWSHANGPIPDGMEVCHSCDNPGCVRLSHLFLGTHRDNLVDMRDKGRWANQYKRGISA